jgi:saccharopine dehydrogenase (NAD+, L-lysine-forming)
VCAALVADGIPVLATGRDGERLTALAAQLGPQVESAVAALDDADALRQLATRASVVLNCAGPFATCGKPLQDAALSASRHYLDLAGEPEVVRSTLARDAEAKQRNVVLVSGAGFDVVPTDSLACVLAKRLEQPIRSARVAYSHLDAGATSGLGLTMLQGLLEGGVAVQDGAWTREELGLHQWLVPFPQPFGPRLCASAPWGDPASLSRSTGASTARAYAPRTNISPVAVSRVLRGLRKILPAKMFSALCETVARDLAKGLPTATDFLSAVVEVSGQDKTLTGWLTATPGLVAHAAALCARLARADDFRARGAHTPATAFGADKLLSGLRSHGLKWGVYDAPS